MRRTDRTKRIAVAVAAAASILLACAGAQAFCRTTTVRSPPTFDGMDSCWSEGKPLYHASACLPYRLLAKESAIIPNAVLSEKLGRAFGVWTAPNPTCTPGISAIELAPTADTVIVGYRMGERDRNLIGVPPTWPHSDATESLSLATLIFNPDSGEVYGEDLEVNGDVRWSFTESPPPDGFDLQAVLTHEVGHMLGIAQSSAVDATMLARYEPGSIDQRTLHADDQAAICAVYPNRGQRLAGAGLIPSTACRLAPGDPDRGCGEPTITHGCSTAPGESGDVLGLGIVVALGAVVSRRVRRA